eukprot:3293332-Prymnesium_polylepis.1
MCAARAAAGLGTHDLGRRRRPRHCRQRAESLGLRPGGRVQRRHNGGGRLDRSDRQGGQAWHQGDHLHQ